MTDHACPEALQEIIETFRDAAQEERLDILLEYAMNLPDLPEELHSARDTMEQVHECQTPVFLLAQLRDGKVHYYIDVPREAPPCAVLRVSSTKACMALPPRRSPPHRTISTSSLVCTKCSHRYACVA